MTTLATQFHETRDIGGVVVPISLIRMWGSYCPGKIGRRAFANGYHSPPEAMNPHKPCTYPATDWRRGRMFRMGTVTWRGAYQLEALPADCPERVWHALGVSGHADRSQPPHPRNSDAGIWWRRGYADAARAIAWPQEPNALMVAGAAARRRGFPRTAKPKGVGAAWVAGWDRQQAEDLAAALPQAQRSRTEEGT